LPMIFAGASQDEAVEKGLELLALVGLRDRYGHKPQELFRRPAASAWPSPFPGQHPGHHPGPTSRPAPGPHHRRGNHRPAQALEPRTRRYGHLGHPRYKMLNVSDRVVWIRDGCIDKIEERDQLDISVGAIGTGRTSARCPPPSRPGRPDAGHTACLLAGGLAGLPAGGGRPWPKRFSRE